MNVNKLAMPADEMVEAGMTPAAREAYRERMAKWRRGDEQAEDADKQEKGE